MEQQYHARKSYRQPSLPLSGGLLFSRRGGKSNRTMKRNNNRMPNNQTPVSLKPDHTIVVRGYSVFAVQNLQPGYFDHYDVIKPINILSNSAYSHLLDIYESVRVTSITIRCYMPAVSVNTTGITAAMYYRDVLTGTPQRYREQLVEEPGHKTGRSCTIFTFNWRPIEPSDYEFYDHAQFSDMDSGRYGQVNYAGNGLTSPDQAKPFIEYIMKCDFKSLVKPTAPKNAYRAVRPEETPLSLEKLSIDDDDDSASIEEWSLPRPRSRPVPTRR